jgi:glycosyltransferase involved in cell wall biosynthesis
MVDRVLASSRPMRLISRRRYFSHVAQSENSLEYTAYLDITTDWKFETFVNDLRQCSICLLSHAPEENTKSQNRLITAVANGVPVIVTTAPSCEGLLRACGLEYAIVSNEDQLDHALLRLSDVEERRNYLNKLQNVVNARFGDEEIASRYEVLVKQHIALPGTKPMNRRMRVLFVSHNLSAGEGAPTSLLQTVLGLKSDHAIDPVVFSVRPGALEEKYRQAGIEVIVPDFGAGSRITSKIIGRSHKELAECLREVITRYGIEAMVVNTATCLGFVLIAESMNIPSLAMIRESSSEHVNFTFGPSIVMDACRKGLDLVKRTVFVSEYTRQLWQQHHTLKCPSVIPNGISVANFDNVKALDKATARRLIKQPDDGVLLLSVGSINARKSQLDIIEALAALPEEAQRKLRLVLVGAKPSEYLDSVKARLAELPILRDRVHIEEETAEIGAWYRAADVFVFASRNESYPRVIVEAMSFGLPLVSSTVFGTQEQIVENESGLLFVPGDVAALSGHLLHILSDEHLRTEMSKSSAERFWELTSYHEMVNQYATLIYDLAHDSRSEDAAQAKSVMVAEPAITQS